jgi:hypothetical protein
MMALYHPMEDANHCFFRMLLLAKNLSGDTTDVETFRLMDFYCLFPASLSEIKLPRELLKYRRAFKEIPRQYEPIPNKSALFERLRHIQNNALGCLVSLGFFDRARFLEDAIALTDLPIPTNLAAKMSLTPIVNEEWFKFLIHGMPSIRSDGPDGWKARTHLSEFRYDTL